MSDPPVLDLDSRVRRRDDVPWRVLDGVVLVLDLNSGDFFELDEVGGCIWQGLDGGRTLGDQARMLAGEYAVAFERAAADVVAFVTDLCSRQLASPVD